MFAVAIVIPLTFMPPCDTL